MSSQSFRELIANFPGVRRAAGDEGPPGAAQYPPQAPVALELLRPPGRAWLLRASRGSPVTGGWLVNGAVGRIMTLMKGLL